MPKARIPEKLAPLFTKPKRFKIAYGGRGGGKSIALTDYFLMQAQVEGAKTMCLREHQASIEDSVHALLSSEIDRLGIRQGFDIQKTTIQAIDGGKFRFKGLARSADAIKSAAGFRYFWVEEAQFTSRGSLEQLTPSLRAVDGPAGELFFSFNPLSSADPISQRFIVPFQHELDRSGYYEDDSHVIVKINYKDNPFFPAELELERRLDYDRLPRAEYLWKWEGAFFDLVPHSIILPEWFDAAVDAHKRLNFPIQGRKVTSFDPADEGGDAKAVSHRHGSYLVDVIENVVGDVNEGCDWAIGQAVEFGADNFIWDVGGMGLTLKRQVKDGLMDHRISHYLFNGAETPDEPDEEYISEAVMENVRTNRQVFTNKRAQYYGRLRDRFYNTYLAVEKGKYIDPAEMISVNPEIKLLDKLRSEICRIPRKPHPNGMFQIMRKDEMKVQLKIQSPNMADAVMMDFGFIPPPIMAESGTLFSNFNPVDLEPEYEPAF